MNFFARVLAKINPEWPLRLGLGLMYLYSGYDIYQYPKAWTWAIPYWFRQAVEVVMNIETYLVIQGIGEIILGLLFLAWFSGRWGLRVAALFSTIEMAGILLFTGVTSTTFRDIGLLGASFALMIISFKDVPRANEFQS